MQYYYYQRVLCRFGPRSKKALVCFGLFWLIISARYYKRIKDYLAAVNIKDLTKYGLHQGNIGTR